MTASTRRVTLSLVMASWPGTDATVICMLTLRSRSVTGLIQVSPGSRVPGSARPKRKTMPFSYWEMILKPNMAAVSGLRREIFEAVPESAIVPDGNAQFFGSRMIGLPRQLQGLLPFPERLDEFLDPVIDQA